MQLHSEGKKCVWGGGVVENGSTTDFLLKTKRQLPHPPHPGV